MIKFLSLVLVLAVGYQASADDLKIFRKAVIGVNLGIVGGKKGYIHCERTSEGDRAAIKLIRLGRDGVELRDGVYKSRADNSKIFVESRFKKSLPENGSEEKVFADTDHIRNKFLKARDICDDHKALQSGNQLVRNKEPGDNDNDRDQDQGDAQPEPPSAPSAPAPPSAPPAPEND